MAKTDVTVEMALMVYRVKMERMVQTESPVIMVPMGRMGVTESMVLMENPPILLP